VPSRQRRQDWSGRTGCQGLGWRTSETATLFKF
jgi:hypothetical protein